MITCGHAHFVVRRMNCYNHIINMLQQLLTASQSPVSPTHSPVKPGPPSLQLSNQNQQTPNPKQQVLYVESLYTYSVHIHKLTLTYKMCLTVYMLDTWEGGGAIGTRTLLLSFPCISRLTIVSREAKKKQQYATNE